MIRFGGDASLFPYYAQIRQFGIDAQITAGTRLCRMKPLRNPVRLVSLDRSFRET